MRKIIVAATALTSTLVLAGAVLGAGSAGTTLTAKLNNAQEVPKPNASGGSGKFTATLTGRSLKWKLTFAHLTGAGQAAHIHLGKRGRRARSVSRSAAPAGRACTARRRSRRRWRARSGQAGPT